MSQIEKLIVKNEYEGIAIHKPHPSKILKPYQVKRAIDNLYEWGYFHE